MDCEVANSGNSLVSNTVLDGIIANFSPEMHAVGEMLMLFD